MIKHYCDRCGREITSNIIGFKIQAGYLMFNSSNLLTTSPRFKRSGYDLCPYCLSDLREFLDEQKGLG